jgi:DNA modification methylase
MTAVLHLGDCLEVMKTLPAGSVDAVVTDPPYGINGNYATYQDTPENLARLVPAFLGEARRVARFVVAVFTGVSHTELYVGATWRMAWVRPGGTGSGRWGFNCWTPIAVYGKDPYLSAGKGSRPDVYVDYKGARVGVAHPFEKPMPIMTWLLERVNPGGGTILDPFMGSGTTGVACVQTGRNFIGIEIDPGYFAIAKKRIEEAQLQMRMEI